MTSFPTALLLLAGLFVLGSAQIRLSFDLNCDFSHQCRWRNDTVQPESVGWAITSDVAAANDGRFPQPDGRKGGWIWWGRNF